MTSWPNRNRAVCRPPEVDVSPDLIRKLIVGQHQDLADLPIQVLANGWDNFICRLGGDLLVMLPRREIGAQLVVHEQEWLQVLPARLPLAVPALGRVGPSAQGYPLKGGPTPFPPRSAPVRD